jgi:hypothetical protein
MDCFFLRQLRPTEPSIQWSPGTLSTGGDGGLSSVKNKNSCKYESYASVSPNIIIACYLNKSRYIIND